ncbi:MAG: tetratricopeptide repeat protein [Clostridia bacterium]|nr:tetratricopeptide repeat protein [Clostridia bacterium]
MFRKALFTVLAIMFVLTSIVGCGQKETKTVTQKPAKFDAKTVVKDLKGDALAGKINEYMEEGDIDKAVAVGEAAMGKEPGNLSVLLNLSNAYYFQKDMLNMVKVSKKMDELSPNNPTVLNQLAWALIDSGENPAEGVKKAEQAMLIIKQSGQVIDPGLADTRAYGLYKQGKKAEAISEWQKALPRAQSGEIYLHLGQALFETGKKTEAKPILERALSLIKVQLKDANLTKVEVKHLEQVKVKIEGYLKELNQKQS